MVSRLKTIKKISQTGVFEEEEGANVGRGRHPQEDKAAQTPHLNRQDALLGGHPTPITGPYDQPDKENNILGDHGGPELGHESKAIGAVAGAALRTAGGVAAEVMDKDGGPWVPKQTSDMGIMDTHVDGESILASTEEKGWIAGQLEKEGDGGGIAGSGNTTVGADVHTETGGSSKQRRHESYKGVPIIRKVLDHYRVQQVKVMKAVENPEQYDLHILNKQVTGDQNPGRFVIAGYASPVMVDLEGHKITREALERDLPRFMANQGSYANVNVLHSNVTVGRILPNFTDVTGNVYRTMVDDVGLFVVAEVRTDPNAPMVCQQVIEDIQSGTLRSFSISGNAENPTFTCDGERCFYSINDLQLYEVTICEEGVNPEAKFNVIAKMLDPRKSYRGIRMIRKNEYQDAYSDPNPAADAVVAAYEEPLEEETPVKPGVSALGQV